jgi:hypothetical protein
VTTQLRLVDAPMRRPADRAAGRRRTAKPASKGRVSSTKVPARHRAAHWGDWQLDAQTRRVGRAGVAAARKVLDDARRSQELPRAS